MFKGRLSVQSDAFYEYRDNILANRSTEPFIIGAELPAYNLGSMKNFGCEFDLTWRDKVKDFNYWVRGNFSFARNRIVFKDEVNKQYKYQAETGRRYGQFFGLISTATIIHGRKSMPWTVLSAHGAETSCSREIAVMWM